MGDWLNPMPTPEEINHWLFLPGGRHKVSRWPTHGTPRSSAIFRVRYSHQWNPTALKWLVHVRRWNDVPLDPPNQDIDRWGEFELGVLPGEERLYGICESGDLDVFEMWVEAVDTIPTVGKPGVLVTADWRNLNTSGGLKWERYWAFDAARPWQREMYTDIDLPSHSVDTLQQPANFDHSQVEVFSVSDCYEFARFPEEEGFADIGPGRWIEFPVDFPHTLGPIRVEFDIHPINDIDLAVTSLRRFQSFSGGFAGLNTFRWWNRTVNLNPTLTLGAWQHVEAEWNWSVPGAEWRVWIDGQLAGQQPETAQNNPFDNIGWNEGNGPGEFKLRNFKQFSGSAAAPILDVDLPLTLNACDGGIGMQKGTTFNMDVPSCP